MWLGIARIAATAGFAILLINILTVTPLVLTKLGIDASYAYAKGGSGGGGAGGGGSGGGAGGAGGGPGGGGGGNGNGNGGGVGGGNGNGNGAGSGGGNGQGQGVGNGNNGGEGAGTGGGASSGSGSNGGVSGSSGTSAGSSYADEAMARFDTTRFEENIEVTRGQVLQSALSASSVPSNAPIRNRPAPVVLVTTDTLSWPEIPSGRFLLLSGTHRASQRERAPASPLAVSWLDGQTPLTPLAVPLWKTVKEVSSFIPESWYPVMRSRYFLSAVILILVVYPLGRLIWGEIAAGREERDSALYD